MNLGWKGKKVRHTDGRQGRIADEWIGFCHAGLKIEVEGGGEGFVQLNTTGRDSGETGWQWWCENFSHGARWLPLGDHST